MPGKGFYFDARLLQHWKLIREKSRIYSVGRYRNDWYQSSHDHVHTSMTFAGVTFASPLHYLWLPCNHSLRSDGVVQLGISNILWVSGSLHTSHYLFCWSFLCISFFSFSLPYWRIVTSLGTSVMWVVWNYVKLIRDHLTENQSQ